MSDKALGYFVLALLGILIIVFGVFFAWANYFPMERRIIFFPEIGNLKIEDPVTENGVVIGKVERIDWRPKGVYVSIKISKPLILRHGYRIFIDDKGLMGERVINFFCGAAGGADILPKGDTLCGVMKIGVSEAIGMMWMLEFHTKRIRKDVALLRYGGQKTPAFATSFWKFSHDIDSLSEQMVILVRSLRRSIAVGLDTIEHHIAGAASLTNSIHRELPRYEDELNAFTQNAAAVCEKIQGVIDSASTLLGPLSSPHAALWRDDLSRMGKQLQLLRHGVKKLRERGLQLPVQIMH